MACIEVAREGGVGTTTTTTTTTAGGEGEAGDGEENLFYVEHAMQAAPDRHHERHHARGERVPPRFNPRHTFSAGAARGASSSSVGANGAQPHYSGYSDRAAQRSDPLGAHGPAHRPAPAAAAAATSSGGFSRRGNGVGNGFISSSGGYDDVDPQPQMSTPVDSITAQVQAAIAAAAEQVARAGETGDQGWSPAGRMIHAAASLGGGGGGVSPTVSPTRVPRAGRPWSSAETAEDLEVMRRLSVGHRPSTPPTGVPHGTAGGGQRPRRLIFGGGYAVRRKSVMELREKEAGRGAFAFLAHNPETYQDTVVQHKRSFSSRGLYR